MLFLRGLAPKSRPLRWRGRHRAICARQHHVGLATPPAPAPGEAPRAHAPNSELSAALLVSVLTIKAFPVPSGPGTHGCWALHVSVLLVGRGRPWRPRGDPAPADRPMGMWAEASVALGSSGRNTAEEHSAGSRLAGLLARVWPWGALPSLSPAPHLPPCLGYVGYRETKQLDRLCWEAAGGPCVPPPPPAARSLPGGWLGALLPAVTAGPFLPGLATWLLASFCHNRASPGR